MPRLHVAWGSGHRWAKVFCLCSSRLSDSEDSDSLLLRGLVPCLRVPSGIECTRSRVAK